MTALRKYLRLESSGLWRETPDARLREVVVGLREATLVLSDPKTEVALSQWSLPAVERLNPGKMPARYGVGAEMTETLEIDDSDMAAALETVRAALDGRRPQPGRLRGLVLAGFAASAAALAIFWLPGKLLDYTAAMLPAATRADLGKDALADLTKLTGSVCITKSGNAAFATLSQRLSPDHPLHIFVVRAALARPVSLPGGIIVLPNSVLQSADGPDVIAGFVLAEMLRIAAADPTRAVLRHAGMLATLQLLTQGAIGAAAFDGYGETLLSAPPVVVTDDALIAQFRASGISSASFGYALDKSGETTLALIEADPNRSGSSPPVLDDATWLNLQAICAKG